MPIFIHRYELRPRVSLGARAGLGARRGALLRIDDGFADLHPWPELGDAPLDDQLARLARGQTTPLTRASLRLAAIDGTARREGRSLFQDSAIPASHFLITEVSGSFDAATVAARGFDTVKVKMGRNLAAERAWLDCQAPVLRDFGLKVRIDFNGVPDATEIETFLAALSDVARGRIDFIEDPCRYDGEVWHALSSRFGCRLALDRGDPATSSDGVAVVVVKPAFQDDQEVIRLASERGQMVVITSYMDHPIGQLGAAFCAARAAAEHPNIIGRCGLLTHALFEPDAFLEQMYANGPHLLPPGGTGLGFDGLLDQLPWKQLS
ncbi:MAG TPA: hypothetical protein VEZ11_13455 [Thermoanaerobaculia bacterium]|nr:hypothetical protein [Thermoanaerobaculia bacterium]